MDNLISQEPVLIDNKNDFFGVENLINKIKKLISGKEKHIIGIFDGYGEGKSSLIKTLKNRSDGFCFIDFDLWLYEKDELSNEFYKVFSEEKGKYIFKDKVFDSFFRFTQKYNRTRNLAEIYVTNKSLERNFLLPTYFAIKKKLSKKRTNCPNNKKHIIVIENLDRLTIEEKVIALSKIYNYREYIDTHIIITLNPDSIENNIHFENLVHKCFSIYFYLNPKTKESLFEYVKNQLQKMECKNSEKLCNILLTQYPISLREINHCLNNFCVLKNTKDINNIKLSLFISILQTLYPFLYKAISKNPFILKRFIEDINDVNFHAYKEYGIDKNQAYKLNLVLYEIKDILNFEEGLISIFSPLYKQNSIIGKLELLRKAKLYDDILIEIKKQINVDESSKIKFITEAIKDKKGFVNLFESEDVFSEVYSFLEKNNTEDEAVYKELLKTVFICDIQDIKDSFFYDNYLKIIELFCDRIKKDRELKRLLIYRLIVNQILIKKVIVSKECIELFKDIFISEKFTRELKKLDFIKKIIYLSYIVPYINSVDIGTDEISLFMDIMQNGITNLDKNHLDSLGIDERKIIIYFYTEGIFKNFYVGSSFMIEILDSPLFQYLDLSQKINFYEKIFTKDEFINDENIDFIIDKFFALLEIEDLSILQVKKITDILLNNILLRIDNFDIYENFIFLKKFVKDNKEKFILYDATLQNNLNLIDLKVN